MEPATPGRAAPRRRLPAVALSALVAVAVVITVASVTHWYGRERRALLALEPEARRALYQQTLTAFRGLCVLPPDPALEPRCAEQGEFLRRFPECDGACLELTAPWVQQPTR